MEDANYEPMEPYPDAKEGGWTVRCKNCGYVRVLVPAKVVKMSLCSCTRNQRRVEENLERLRSAGYRLIAPPSYHDRVWTVECTRCQAKSTLSTLESLHEKTCCAQ